MTKTGKLILLIIAAVFLTGCVKKTDQGDALTGSVSEDGADTVITPLSEDMTATGELEILRKLYIDFPQRASYEEALSFVGESELPYWEKKENGSRRIIITLEQSDTAMEEPDVNTLRDYDYIEISYMYPKQEDDRNDELDKYFFAGILYISSEGKYQLESHGESTFITADGEVIDSQMNRQDQIGFLEDHISLAVE